MSEKEIKAMESLAVKVKSNFEAMNIGEIINRIHYITGRDITHAINGYKLLRSMKLIKDEFVKEVELEERYLRVISHPKALLLIERFQCVLHRVIDYRKEEAEINNSLRDTGEIRKKMFQTIGLSSDF